MTAASLTRPDVFTVVPIRSLPHPGRSCRAGRMRRPKPNNTTHLLGPSVVSPGAVLFSAAAALLVFTPHPLGCSCRRRGFARALVLQCFGEQRRHALPSLDQIAVLLTVASAGHRKLAATSEPMAKPVAQCGTSVRPQCRAGFQIQPQHDLGPHPIPTLSAWPGSSGGFHTQITGGNGESAIDDQIIHERSPAAYTRQPDRLP